MRGLEHRGGKVETPMNTEVARVAEGERTRSA
jgi:hypothetical protein